MRIEWTRLEGNDVEAVVAMFINREHPRATRITPSSGDGGIDILHRDAQGDTVYQVKRYSGPLSASQKGEVEKSLARLLGPRPGETSAVTRDPRWVGLNVTEWHLALPWDPSPEAELWLHELGEAYGLTVVWDGLTVVDGWAAKYMDVVDYYLHGGQARIAEAYQQVAASFGVDQGSDGLSVPTVNLRVQKALDTLSHDPHYRYEHHYGEGEPPPPSNRPGLVFSWMAIDRSVQRWTAVDVIARSLISVQERPITVDGFLDLEPGSAEEAEFLAFLDYGAPFTSSAGAYRGQIIAPGGLGGDLDGASVSMGGLLDVGENPNLILEILSPEEEVLASVDLLRVARSAGRRGYRVVLEEEKVKAFTIEDRYDLESASMLRTLQVGDVTGRPVAPTRDALAFLLHCRLPNTGRLSIRHAPNELGSEDQNVGILPEGEPLRARVADTHRLLSMLSAMQAKSSVIIKVPDFDLVEAAHIDKWRFAEALLAGRAVSATYDGGGVTFEIDETIDPGLKSFEIAMPLVVPVGAQQVDLGKMRVELEGAALLEREDLDGGRKRYVFETADRLLTYRYP